jgi:hypothetical protein
VPPVVAPQQTRDTGTLGMTGGLFEPKDFIGKVQKGETVFTPQQLENLVRGVSESAGMKFPPEFKSMFETIQTNIKTVPLPDMQGQTQLMNAVLTNVNSALSSVKKDGTAPIDPEKIIEKVKTEMSTATSQLKSQMSSNDPLALFDKAFKAQNLFGNLDAVIPNNPVTKTGEAAKEIPASTKKAKEEAAAKTDNDNKKAAAAQQTTTATTNNRPSTALSGTSTLDDLKEQLIQLNKTMGELVSYTADVASSAEKQARATKRLDPNVALR